MKHLTKNKIHLYFEFLSGEAKASSRACLTLALSSFLEEMGEGKKKIEKDERGKPYFSDFPSYHLSLTHSGPFFAACFAPFPIGIDAEKKEVERKGVCERYFSPREREDKFSRIWCAKEAVGKLTGFGLSDALRCRIEGNTALLDGKRYSLFYEEVGDYLVCMATEE